MKRKTRLLWKTLGDILRAVWQLVLLGIYTASKLTETVSAFIGKLTERFIKD